MTISLGDMSHGGVEGLESGRRSSYMVSTLITLILRSRLAFGECDVLVTPTARTVFVDSLVFTFDCALDAEIFAPKGTKLTPNPQPSQRDDTATPSDMSVHVRKDVVKAVL